MITSFSRFCSENRQGFFITLAVATALAIAGAVGAQTGANQTPVITSASLRPLTFGDGVMVYARVEAYDREGDPLTYIYQWFKNGTPLVGANGISLDLSQPGNGSAGDTIGFGVVVGDGYTETAPTYSSASPIVNTAPNFTVTAPDTGERITSGTDYFIQWQGQEPDEEEASVAIAYRLHGGDMFTPLTSVALRDQGYHWVVPLVTTGDAYLQFQFSDGTNRGEVVVGPLTLEPPVAPVVPATAVPAGAIIRPGISNIVVAPGAGAFNVTWDTDQVASGALIYDLESHNGIERAENYGYAYRVEEGAIGTHHFMRVSGIEPGRAVYFRIVSRSDEDGLSSEQTVLVTEPAPVEPPPAPLAPSEPVQPIVVAPETGTLLVAPEPVLTPEPQPAPEPVPTFEITPEPAPAPAPELVVEPVPAYTPAPAPAPAPVADEEPILDYETPVVNAPSASVEPFVPPSGDTNEPISGAEAGVSRDESLTPGTNEPLSKIGSLTASILDRPWARWVAGLVVLFVIWLLVRGFRKPETPGYTMTPGMPTMPPPPSPSGMTSHQSTILPPPPPNA